MGVKIYKILRNHLRRAIDDAVLAANDGGREVCGLLVDNGYLLEVVKTGNKIKRGGGYEYYYSEVRSIVKAAGRLGHETVGTFHSHPLSIAKPGESDIANAVEDSLMLIIDVVSKKTRLWHIVRGAAKEVKYTLL
jgi:proteasome lid subunit RPN8/RPN11